MRDQKLYGLMVLKQTKFKTNFDVFLTGRGGYLESARDKRS